MRTIPVYEPALSAEDARAVARAVEEGAISGTSPVVRELEAACADRFRMPHAVGVSSGTAALELAVAGLDIGPGDEVVCPSLTIISCARAIVLAGARPVLVDVDPATYCLDPEQVAARVTPRTRAILGVHAFGHPYDHAALRAIAAPRGIPILEDAAQAHGAAVETSDGPLPCGGLGDVSVMSFYANKAVTMGEGGVVLARSAALAERVRDLSNLCLRGPRRFLHQELGHNYRLSGVQAALGLSQLARLDRTVAEKRRVAALYRERLAGMPEIELPGTRPGASPVEWMSCVVLSDAVSGDAAALAAALAARGIETRPFFVGLHEQPALHARGFCLDERHPVTERLSRRGLYLPSAPALTEEDVTIVVDALGASLRELLPARVAVPASPTPAADAERDDGPVFGPEFAAAYDALYAGKDYGAEVDLALRAFERFRSREVRRVLELGCGTGRHAVELLRRGLGVAGVDRSAAMLGIARERAPGARFLEGDMCTVDAGETFDAVLILFAALCYQTTSERILAALRTARRHLEPGGLLLADVWMFAQATGRDVRSHRTARQGDVEWSRTGRFFRDPVAQRVDVAYELVRRSGGEQTTFREVHPMHYFSPFELDFALRCAGFRLVALTREGDLDASPGPQDSTALFVAEAT